MGTFEEDVRQRIIVNYMDYAKVGLRRRFDLLPNYFGHVW